MAFKISALLVLCAILMSLAVAVLPAKAQEDSVEVSARDEMDAMDEIADVEHSYHRGHGKYGYGYGYGHGKYGHGRYGHHGKGHYGRYGKGHYGKGHYGKGHYGKGHYGGYYY